MTTTERMPIRRPIVPISRIAALRTAAQARLGRSDPRLDVLIDSYVEWREECTTVETAYARWARAERPRRALAYAAYRAALDREEKAADVYGLAVTELAGIACEQPQA
ncbi:MAG TPA: hypothetical protein VFW09_04430 [Solirubrobacteraceae bacterium]|nr:hypothetical protein [Solirubrobacteraceae bacterium]